MNASEALSAGLKAVPNKVSSFASTQAAWRFYKNEAVTLSKLQEPLTAAAHAGIQQQCGEYALCVHDWSKLRYRHRNKPDIYPNTFRRSGYELQTSLILSDQTGNPIAPVAQLLVSADGSYATYGDDAAPNASVQNHLDEVSDCIAHLEQQNFARPLVHVMDREADSIACAAGRPMVFTGSCAPRATPLLSCKARRWLQGRRRQARISSGAPRDRRGEKRRLWIAEAEVTLRRPAKPYSKNGKRTLIPGPPVTARLVVSRILSDLGEVEAEWLLLSNVVAEQCKRHRRLDDCALVLLALENRDILQTHEIGRTPTGSVATGIGLSDCQTLTGCQHGLCDRLGHCCRRKPRGCRTQRIFGQT